MDEFREAVSSVDLAGGALVIEGKSFGARVASMVVDSVPTRGLVCLGYPFHPIGKPEQLRTVHLTTLVTPTLVCQGTRELLGSSVEVAGYGLPPIIQFCWLEEADHDFRPRKATSGRTAAQNLDEAANAVGGFLVQVVTSEQWRSAFRCRSR